MTCTQPHSSYIAQLETWVRSLDREDPLEKEMATHSSILAWRIPGTEESGGLPSMGSHRLIIVFVAKDGEALYSQQKQDQELTVAQIMNSLLPNSDSN